LAAFDSIQDNENRYNNDEKADEDVQDGYNSSPDVESEGPDDSENHFGGEHVADENEIWDS